MNKWATLAIIIMLAIVAVTAPLVAGHRKDENDVLKHDKKVLIAQNKKLTQDIQTAKADAFRDGIMACTNEDVTWFNEQADYYRSLAGANPFSKLMRKWAQTWAYDEATLDEKVEAYMNEGSH